MSNLGDKISNNIDAAKHKLQAADAGMNYQKEANVASNPNNTMATRAGATANAAGEKIRETYHDFTGEVKKS
jgi:hypothetical protein